jgi:hypothetical protein
MKVKNLEGGLKRIKMKRIRGKIRVKRKPKSKKFILKFDEGLKTAIFFHFANIFIEKESNLLLRRAIIKKMSLILGLSQKVKTKKRSRVLTKVKLEDHQDF